MLTICLTRYLGRIGVMYNVVRTNRFDKDLVRCQKRGLDLKQIFAAIKLLESTGHLPREYKPHKLKGKFKGVWECHIFSFRQALMQTSSVGNSSVFRWYRLLRYS